MKFIVMALEPLISIIIGIVLIVVGTIEYKRPEAYLEFFGARLLIFFKEETRIKVVRLLGLVVATLGFALIAFGIIGQ